MAFDLTQIPLMLDMHKGVSIRTLDKKSLKDIRLFNSLHNESFKEHFDFRPSTLEEARFWIQHNSWVDVSEYFIADLSSLPVGFVGVGIDTKCNEYRNRLRGWVFTIGVLKPHRLKGVGTALMLHGIKHLKLEGMEEAALWVDDQNPTKAIKLYEKIGFKVIKKSLCYLRKLI
jgi:ribosomal protein S18 acetylase RimI-like enzyme